MSHLQGGAANRGLGGLAAGYTQAQIDEMRQFNAGLTAAGNKSRPNRGGNRGGTRDRGPAPTPRSRVSTLTHANSGSGIGYVMVSNYVVGSSTTSPISKNPSPPRGQSPVRKQSPVRTAPTSKEFAPEKQNIPENGIPDYSDRIIIISNKSDGLSKPWIAAHLHQTSARQTIEEIARMCGQAFEEITDDGIAIPGSRPKATPTSVQAPTMLQAPVPPPVLPTAPATDTTTVQTQVQTQTVQPNVDPNDWFAAYFKKVKIDTEMGALAQPLQSGAPQAFPSDVDVDMESPPAPENAALLDSEVGQMSTAAFLASSTFQTSLMTAQVNELPSNMPRLKDSRWATTGAGSTLTTTAPFTIDWGTAPVQPAAPSGWNATITYNTMSATNLAHTYNPTPAHKTEPSRDLSTSFNAATNGTAPRRLLKDSRWAC